MFQLSSPTLAGRIVTLRTLVVAASLSAFSLPNAVAGGEDSAANQATISAASRVSSYIPLPGMDVAATMDSVDGRAIGAGTRQASMDPGVHTLSLTCRALGATNTEVFELNALPGARYQASTVVGGQRIVPCTSIIERKLESGAFERVPLTYKVESDGLFRLKEGVAVRVPTDCIADIAIYSRDRSVDFVANREDWFASGQYTVKLTKIPKSVTDDVTFIRKIEPDAKDYIDDRPRDRLNLVLKEGKRLDIDGQPGYRVVASSEGKIAFVATFVLQKSWVSIASLTYRLQPGSDAMSAIPWSCYDRFVGSMKQLQ